jgi:RES domain-containing protein
MVVFRLCSRRHAGNAFSGEGARLYGGRWNQRGTRLVYCSETLSLAVLELLVHLDVPVLPPDIVVFRVSIPASISRTTWEVGDLPHRWRQFPAPTSLQTRGSAWVESGRTAVLVVPSVVVTGERNYLLNPVHPAFARIAVGAPARFRWDERLARLRSAASRAPASSKKPR